MPEPDLQAGRAPWVFLAATLGLMLLIVVGLKAGQSHGVPLLVDEESAGRRTVTFEATLQRIFVKDGHVIAPGGVAVPTRFGWIYTTDGHVLRTQDAVLLAGLVRGGRYRLTCEAPAVAQVARLCAAAACPPDASGAR